MCKYWGRYVYKGVGILMVGVGWDEYMCRGGYMGGGGYMGNGGYMVEG